MVPIYSIELLKNESSRHNQSLHRRNTTQNIYIDKYRYNRNIFELLFTRYLIDIDT